MKKILKNRWHKHYSKSNQNRYRNLIIDGLLFVIVLSLILLNAYLSTGNSGLVLGTQYDNQNNDTENNQNQNSDNKAESTDDQIPVEQKVIRSTDLKLQSLARYYTAEGEQLGIGPLPPIVDTATTYWIFISLSGFTHDLEDVSVSAKLPDNVSLTGKSSVTWGGNMSFNERYREIKWSLNNLPVADDDSPIGLAFEIKLVPDGNQIGSAANLLTSIKIAALDSITKETVIRANQNITTNLVGDKIASSDGIVITK